MEQAIVIENLDILKKRVSNTGFGDRFNKSIDEALAAGHTDIQLFTSEMIENKKVDFEPEIKVKDNKGYYNGFKATFYEDDGSAIAQWFKASDHITINEAYILMMDQQHPRAVHKTYFDEAGEKYGQWIQLDFTQKTDSGNHLTKRYNDYDQVAKLNDYDFVELSTDRQKIIAAAYMSEGREIELTPVNQENYKQVLIRANPERNTFTILDATGKLLLHDQFRTEEARQRIQHGKNAREANVSFVRETSPNKTTGKNTSPEISDAVKKKNHSDSSEALKLNRKPRVVQEKENKKGKSL